jgi:3-isopropylmalate dehydrogenase
MWLKEGNTLPERTVELLKWSDCAFFGAVTSKPQAEAMSELPARFRGKGIKYSSALIRIRQQFDLFTCLRPCKAFPGNPGNFKEGIDIAIFRENTEGIYCGAEWGCVPQEFFAVRGMERVSPNAAISIRAITRRASQNIARAAFEYAEKHGRKKITAVHKANVLRATDGLFLDAVRQIAQEHPNIRLEEMYIDNCCLQLVLDPLKFDIILTTNLFGDILSDLCAGLVGGLGFAPSANIGRKWALFEPAHGSAPDIAGLGIANPIAAILSAAMMAGWLGEKKMALNIEAAVADVIKEGKVRTPDMGGKDGTPEMGKAIAGKLR